MRVDQMLRAWLATLPGMVSGKDRSDCYAQVSYEIGGNFSNDEIRDALDRAGYLVQDRTERELAGEQVVCVLLLPEQSME